MNRSFKIEKRNSKKMQFCILIMFVFFAGSSAFSQSSRCEISLNEDPTNKNAVNATSVKMPTSGSNSNVNFILWFMGTKEDVNSTKSNNLFYSKKSILTSGREPNHLLLKTLLKKAINIESC